MDDHDRIDQTLALLGRPGAYDVLATMHQRGGCARFAQIAAETPHPTALLRAMAADGFLITPDGGTLDADPNGDAHLCLTTKGEAIFGHLQRLRAWMASRPPPTGRRRPTR